jgi:hypothetical protein
MGHRGTEAQCPELLEQRIYQISTIHEEITVSAYATYL